MTNKNKDVTLIENRQSEAYIEQLKEQAYTYTYTRGYKHMDIERSEDITQQVERNEKYLKRLTKKKVRLGGKIVRRRDKNIIKGVSRNQGIERLVRKYKVVRCKRDVIRRETQVLQGH